MDKFTELIEKTLIILSGKKSVIATIVTTLNWYLLFKGIYGEAEFALVSTIIVTLCWGASIATKSIYNDK